MEQAVYRKSFEGAPWGLPHPIEELVILQAIHGDYIDGALVW